MGNCQASEAATVVIQHPGGKVERMYWSVRAREVMESNPGHYVAVVVAASDTPRTEDGSPLRRLKLLRPDDTLHIGHVYRLISFEEVLKQIATKKHVKLSRMLLTQQKERGNNVEKKNKKSRREKTGGGEGGAGSSSPPDRTPAPVEEARRRRRQQEEEELQRGEEEDGELFRMATSLSSMSMSGRGSGVQSHGQWRPVLQSIAEVES